MLNYIQHLDYDKKVKIEQIGDLHYSSKKKMKELYPKAGYIVIGAIGKGLSEQAGCFLNNEKEELFYTLHFNKVLNRIDGYIDCGNEQYIAIIDTAARRNLWIFILFMLCNIAIVCLFLTMLGSNTFDPNAKSYTPTAANAIVTDPDHIALPGYEDIRMEANTDVAYVALWNPDGNPCIFKFTLVKDGEVLYESGMVEPGKAITEVKLSKPIPKGEHDAILKIQSFATDNTKIELNGGEVLIKLIGLEKGEVQ